ncbi:MAG: hypothetical protein ABIT37_14330 [Luteolibacter sp.]
MAPNTTTPVQRINRLLGEGARIVAIHPGESGIDVTHDITGLLEMASEAAAEKESRDTAGVP